MSPADSRENIAQLSRSLEKNLVQNHTLLEEMVQFARAESLRLAHAQLDHAEHAFAQFRERQDLSGLIGAQQEWLKQMMQDCAASSLCYAEMFQALARQVQAHVKNAAGDLQHQAEAVAEDLGQMQHEMARPHGGGIHVEHPHMPAE